MEWLANNWGNIVGVAGTLLGILGIYLTIKSWKRKIPAYVIRSNNVFKGLDSTIPDVEVKFPGYGPPVTSITITKVAFWNAGNDTIKKNEVVKEDPIIIHAKEGVVFLSAHIIEAVSPLNNMECCISKDRSSVSLTFDYLDSNQGAIIQLFHTGTTDADISMTGTIMGASKIKRYRTLHPSRPTPPLWLIGFMLAVSWIMVLALTAGVIPPDVPPPDQPPAREPPRIPMEVAVIILIIATTVTIGFWWLNYIPKPFSKVNEN